MSEKRYEIIVREHSIEHTAHGSTKSRRYDIYKRVFHRAQSEQVIASVEASLNQTKEKAAKAVLRKNK